MVTKSPVSTKPSTKFVVSLAPDSQLAVLWDGNLLWESIPPSNGVILILNFRSMDIAKQNAAWSVWLDQFIARVGTISWDPTRSKCTGAFKTCQEVYLASMQTASISDVLHSATSLLRHVDGS